MQTILPGIWTFDGLFMGRVYLIETGSTLALFDTSMALSTGAILRQIEATGHALTDVKDIFITHAHPDHVGGLARLHPATGASIWVGEADCEMLQAGTGLAPAHLLKDGDVIDTVRGGMTVVALPGHSAGQVGFWLPEPRLLIAGDAMMNFFNRLTLPFAMATPDMDEARRSVTRVAAMEPAILCLGHGPVLTENTAARVQAFSQQKGLPR